MGSFGPYIVVGGRYTVYIHRGVMGIMASYSGWFYCGWLASL